MKGLLISAFTVASMFIGTSAVTVTPAAAYYPPKCITYHYHSYCLSSYWADYCIYKDYYGHQYIYCRYYGGGGGGSGY